ncbi:MAG: nitroreductase family protein [Anaerolineales bacterium]
MHEKLEFIFKRRSIRVYKPDAIPEETLQALLEAAMAAPSANDVRPWAFIVVRAEERRKELAAIQPWSGMCAKAPVVFAVIGDPTASDHWVEDCSAATENLLLAATALDLGAVWVAVYPRQERERRVRDILQIPEHLRVLCLVPLGFPDEHKSPRTRFEKTKVHYELFQQT